MRKRLKIGLISCGIVAALPVVSMENTNKEDGQTEKKIEEKIILNNMPSLLQSNEAEKKIIQSLEQWDEANRLKKDEDYQEISTDEDNFNEDNLSEIVDEINRAAHNQNPNNSYYYDDTNTGKNSKKTNNNLPQAPGNWGKENRSMYWNPEEKKFKDEDSTTNDTLPDDIITLGKFCEKAVDPDGNTIIHYGANDGNIELITLFKEFVDINKKNKLGKAPIDIAIEKGFEEVIRFFIENGATVGLETFNRLQDPNLNLLNTSSDNFDKLTLNELVYVKVLIEIIKNYNSDKTFLFKAHFCKQFDINTLSDGRNPLHAAVLGNLREIVEFILNNGGKIHQPTSDGLQAIHLAARRGFNDIVNILIKKGADINAKSSLGYPLTLAVKNKRVNTIKLLLSYGPKQETIDEALEFALSNNVVEMIPFLTSNGGKIKEEFIKNNKSPLPALVNAIHRQLTEPESTFNEFEKKYLSLEDSKSTIQIIKEFTPHYKKQLSFKKFKKSMDEWESKNKKKNKPQSKHFLSFDGIFSAFSLKKKNFKEE